MTELTFTIPANLWLSANGTQPYRYDLARIKKALRLLGKATGQQSGLRDLGPTHVAAFIGYPRTGRADPANEAVTKHLIDGLVDAGVWADDDHTHVIGPQFLRDSITGTPGVHSVRLVLTAQDVPWGESA